METPAATMMALLVAVIFIGIALVFAASISGQFPGLNEWFDKLFGKMSMEEQNYKTAVGSTKAVICAINSVSQGTLWEEQGCIYKGSSMASFTGYLTLGEESEPTIECKTSSKTDKEKAVTEQWYGGGVTSNPDPSKYFDCETRGGIFGCYYCERGTRIPGKNDCEYTTSSAECDVKNFYLPQSFDGFFTGKPKEYIAGYGDPAFIIYFQQFPKGEDAAWSSFSEWYRGVGTVLFAGMCISNVLKPVTKPLKLLFQGKKIAKLGEVAKAAGTKVDDSVNWIKSIVDKVKTGKTVFRKTETRINDVTTRIVFTETRKSSIAVLKDVLKEESVLWFKTNWKPAMQNAMVQAGLVSAGAYAAARVDSEIGKIVDEYPSSIVFAQPLKRAEVPYDDTGHNLNIGISSSSTIPLPVKKPVVLKKSNSFTFLGVNAPSSFYLAAPCHADLKVEENVIICDGYSYDSVTGLVTCNVKDVKKDFPSNMRQCGEIDLLETSLDKRMFKDNNGDGMWDEFIFNGEWESGKFLYTPTIKEMNFKDEDYDGTWDWMRIKNNNDIVDVLKSSADNGFFDLADLDNDGRFETKFEPNPSVALDRVKIFKDEDGDGTFEKEITDPAILSRLGYKTAFGLYDGAWKGAEYGKYLENYGSPYLFMMRFADFDDDDKWDWFMNYDSSQIYVDYNKDGVWDFSYSGATEGLSNGYWDCEDIDSNFNCLKGQKVDMSSEGYGYTIDSLGECAVDGITVSVDKSNYKDDEHNFCYTGESGLGIVLMTGSLAIDAFAKRIPSPLTWIGSVVADCGLAYFHMKSQHDWPS